MFSNGSKGQIQKYSIERKKPYQNMKKFITIYYISSKVAIGRWHLDLTEANETENQNIFISYTSSKQILF